MKTHWKKLVVGLLVLGGVAAAAGSDFVDKVDSKWAQWFVHGAYFGPTSPTGNATDTTPLVVNGNATITGSLTTAGQTQTSLTVNGDAGIQGQLLAVKGLQVGPAAGLDFLTDQGGVAYFDGGLSANGSITSVNGAIVSSAGVYQNGGASVLPVILHGSDAGTSGVLSVTFGVAFGAAPDCVCSQSNGTVVACDVLIHATGAAQFKSGSSTDVIFWQCMN